MRLYQSKLNEIVNTHQREPLPDTQQQETEHEQSEFEELEREKLTGEERQVFQETMLVHEQQDALARKLYARLQQFKKQPVVETYPEKDKQLWHEYD